MTVCHRPFFMVRALSPEHCQGAKPWPSGDDRGCGGACGRTGGGSDSAGVTGSDDSNGADDSTGDSGGNDDSPDGGDGNDGSERVWPLQPFRTW